MLQERGQQRAARQGNLDNHVVRGIRTRLEKNAVHGKQDEIDIIHTPNRIRGNKASSILQLTADRDGHVFRSAHRSRMCFHQNAIHLISLELLNYQLLYRGLNARPNGCRPN